MEGLAAKDAAMSNMVKHNDWLFERLKDAEFAAHYLNAAQDDDDPQTVSGQVDTVTRPPVDLVLANAPKPVQIG